MKCKKGLSQVVGTLLMVLITISAIGVVWASINAFVGDRMDQTESCHDIYDKIIINDKYTCYNSSSDELIISLTVNDIYPDSILVAIAYNDHSNNFDLTNVSRSIDTVIGNVKMPEANSGKKYTIQSVEKPVKISLAPKVNGNQCDISSTFSNIPICQYQ